MVVRRNRKGKEGIGQERTERRLDTVLISTAWLVGVACSAWSTAYNSPVWFDWSGYGTLTLTFLGSLSSYQMPLLALAVASLLSRHDPSVYIVSGGVLNIAVFGALVVMAWGGCLVCEDSEAVFEGQLAAIWVEGVCGLVRDGV